MKKYFSLLLFFTFLASMGQTTYPGGIVTSTGFDLQDAQPIDRRTVVNGIDSLAGIPHQFPGLITATPQGKLFVKSTAGWVEMGQGTDVTKVPYTGALADVNLGLHNLTVNNLVKFGTGPLGFIDYTGEKIEISGENGIDITTSQGGSIGTGLNNPYISSTGGNKVIFDTSNLTQERNVDWPDKDGVVAFTSDIPTTLQTITNGGATTTNKIITRGIGITNVNNVENWGISNVGVIKGFLYTGADSSYFNLQPGTSQRTTVIQRSNPDQHGVLELNKLTLQSRTDAKLFDITSGTGGSIINKFAVYEDGQTTGSDAVRTNAYTTLSQVTALIGGGGGGSVPDATSTTAGKAKLYDTTGVNTDGAITQAAATTYVYTSTTPIVDILLPKVLHATQGIETNVYFDNIVSTTFGRQDLSYDVESTLGKHYEKFWRATPSSAGTFAWTINVKYKNSVIATKTVNVVVKATTAGSGSTIKVMTIGDSTGANAEAITTITTDYGTAASPAVVWTGTSGTTPYFHESYGGASAGNFATASTPRYKFYFTGVTTPPVQEAIYSHNGSTFRVVELNATSGTGYVSTVRTGSTTPTTTGTLTKVSGTGDATIAFTSFEIVSANKFWNNTTNQLDFANYFTTNSITMTSSDLIVIHLGINDVFGVPDNFMNSIMNNYVTYVNAIIASARTAVPNINVCVALTIPPSISQDAFGNNYSNTYDLKQYENNNAKIVRRIIDTYDTPAMLANKIYVTNYNTCVDRVNNFPKTTMAANSRNTSTITTWTNGVHPALSGYQQIGDQLYSFIKSLY